MNSPLNPNPPLLPEHRELETGFAAVIRAAESTYGILIPPALESMCRFAFFTGAVEAASLIECHGWTPLNIVEEYRAAFPTDTPSSRRSDGPAGDKGVGLNKEGNRNAAWPETNGWRCAKSRAEDAATGRKE